MTDSQTTLEVTNLNVSRAQAHVLFDINMKLHSKEIVACVGRNGAGKSTLLKSIVGFLKVDSGSVVGLGQSLTGQKPYAIARMGVKYVPQDKRVFSELTVRENLELGSYASGDYDWDKVINFFPKLKILMDRQAGHLSGGERQMLMIGRAILGSPQVILIDEPTEGLSPMIVQHLKHVFTELSKSASVLIVEQNLPLVCSIADRVYAIKEGRLVAELSGDKLTTAQCENYL